MAENYDPKDLEQHAGKVFVTESGTRYWIDGRELVTNKGSELGGILQAFGGIEVRTKLELEGERQGQPVMIEHLYSKGFLQEPKEGLCLLMVLDEEGKLKSNYYATSRITSIEERVPT